MVTFLISLSFLFFHLFSFLLFWLFCGREQLRPDDVNDCDAAIPGLNAVLAHLHGDAGGVAPTMTCEVSILYIYVDEAKATC